MLVVGFHLMQRHRQQASVCSGHGELSEGQFMATQGGLVA